MDILAREAGTWIGYYEDEHTRRLCEGLRRIPGVEEWIPLGQARRGAGRYRPRDGRYVSGRERPPGHSQDDKATQRKTASPADAERPVFL